MITNALRLLSLAALLLASACGGTTEIQSPADECCKTCNPLVAQPCGSECISIRLSCDATPATVWCACEGALPQH